MTSVQMLGDSLGRGFDVVDDRIEVGPQRCATVTTTMSLSRTAEKSVVARRRPADTFAATSSSRCGSRTCVGPPALIVSTTS